MNFYSSDKFSKNNKIPNFMKIRPVEAESFSTVGGGDIWTDGKDGQTWRS